MAKLYIKTGGRGRPMTIDPTAELEDLIQNEIPKARERLSEFRQATSGSRDERIFGSETSLPDYITTSLDILADLQENSTIEIESLRELKKNLKTIKQLSSKQERVYSKSLESQLLSDYSKILQNQNQNSSKFVEESNRRILNKLEQMSPAQRQKFFMSKEYQDPRTMTKEYKRLIAYVSDKLGRQASISEAWAYIREERFNEFGG